MGSNGSTKIEIRMARISTKESGDKFLTPSPTKWKAQWGVNVEIV